jgi:hypothetical protein
MKYSYVISPMKIPSEIFYYDFAVGRKFNHILIYVILFILRVLYTLNLKVSLLY